MVLDVCVGDYVMIMELRCNSWIAAQLYSWYWLVCYDNAHASTIIG